MKQLMVDLETLGTTADAVIMSIGAVKFDLESGEIDDAAFYASISVDSNLELGRRVDESTLIWWFKQPAASQQVFHEPKETLTDALAQFSDWVGSGDYEVWSNGADFDIPMVAHACRQCGIEAPWKFWNSRCYRTYKNLPGAKNVTMQRKGVAHNALADAIMQAEHAAAIYRALFKKTKVKA